jgi:hypothetical protein
MRSCTIVQNPLRREGKTRPSGANRHRQARHEVKRGPIPGNSPNDRILRGPDCNRPMRVRVDSFPATPPQTLRTHQGSRNAFIGHGGVYRSDGFCRPAGAGLPPPVGRRRGPAKVRIGRGAYRPPCAMSFGRLLLDNVLSTLAPRVARQHWPSSLHLYPDPKAVDSI